MDALIIALGIAFVVSWLDDVRRAKALEAKCSDYRRDMVNDAGLDEGTDTYAQES